MAEGMPGVNSLSPYINKFHSWRDFDDATLNKKVILFGVGQGLLIYYFKYGDFFNVYMVVDNSKEFQGIPFKYFVPDFNYNANIYVQDPSCLKDMNTCDYVVLITSLRYYNEIANQLGKMGVAHIFSISCIEDREKCFLNNIDIEKEKEKLFGELDGLPIENKVCVASNCDGAGHAKEIVKQLKKLRKDLDIVWAVNDLHVILEDGIRKCFRGNKYFLGYEYKTSAVWISDGGTGDFPLYIKKRIGQTCVELTHWSSVTLKKFALDEKSIRNNKKLVSSIKNSISLVDYVIVGSNFDEKCCRSGFGIEEGYVYAGSSRSDILFDVNRKKAFLKNYPQLADKNILLYAPTFRRTGEDMSGLGYRHELEFEVVEKALIDKFGGDWVILLRLHPFVAKYSKEFSVPNFVVDVSGYQDVEELVAASDAMITDYSSIMFEPAYINIPVFLLATDRDEYTSNERDFYIDYDSLPFPAAESNDELVDNIKNFNYEGYVKSVDVFLKKYGVHEDGHASERAARFISDLLDGKVHKGEARDKLDYAYGSDTRKF